MHKILILSLSISTILVSSVLAETGTWPCGNNCIATLDSLGNLTISGTGQMDDYSATDAPWYSQKDSIVHIVIQEGMESVGSNAFYNLTNATGISIPDSVKSVGESAFRSMWNVTGSINIPNSVTSIGPYAFLDMKNVTGKFVIPNTITTIETGAFWGLENITSLVIPDSVTSIGEQAFRKAYALRELIIPDSVTSIGNNAFNLVNPSELTISSDKIEMYKNADGGFSNITALHCIDGEDACKTKLSELGYSSLLDTVDTAIKFIKNHDGSYRLETYDGTFVGFRGKRIYTIEEAQAAVKAIGKDHVTFRIRYK